jgi:hypothetical protein
MHCAVARMIVLIYSLDGTSESGNGAGTAATGGGEIAAGTDVTNKTDSSSEASVMAERTNSTGATITSSGSTANTTTATTTDSSSAQAAAAAAVQGSTGVDDLSTGISTVSGTENGVMVGQGGVPDAAVKSTDKVRALCYVTIHASMPITLLQTFLEHSVCN